MKLGGQELKAFDKVMIISHRDERKIGKLAVVGRVYEEDNNCSLLRFQGRFNANQLVKVEGY